MQTNDAQCAGIVLDAYNNFPTQASDLVNLSLVQKGLCYTLF